MRNHARFTRRAPGIQFPAQDFGGVLQVLHRLRGFFHGCALGHGQRRVQVRALDAGEELEMDPAAGEQGQRQGQDDDTCRQGRVAPFHGPVHGGLVVLGGRRLQGAGNPVLQSQPAVHQRVVSGLFFRAAMGEVRGEDQL